MDLTITICAHEMARELPRTIFSLSQGFQKDLAGVSYEIVVIDHGSSTPIVAANLPAVGVPIRVERVSPAPISPVGAINRVMATARGQSVCLMIDGARMGSPRLISTSMQALQAGPSRVVGTLAFHLGPKVQYLSVPEGYDQTCEDRLLETVPWQEDGYRLFDISVLAGSSSGGWFAPIAESNAVFMTAEMWKGIGGLDPRFETAGGGLANLEFWSRAVAASQGEPWMILGEGTFHQVHGGAATNGPHSARQTMQAEYNQIFGEPYRPPRYQARFLGRLSPELARRFG